MQFILTLTTNIEKLSGSPVKVTVDSVSAGSIKIGTTVLFPSGDSSSASTYTSALKSGDTSSVFGNSFGGIAVDASSVETAAAANPSKSGLKPPKLPFGHQLLEPETLLITSNDNCPACF